jgi:MOSC domain-containing protein YiiM
MASSSLLSVHIGKVAPLGPEHVPSGFIKRSVSGTLAVTPLGLSGDEQADLTVHGGPEKAVYGYAASRYPAWQKEFPELAAALLPGSMGENLSIAGMNEADICIGDVHGVGSALLQVCQPRRPCFKLSLRFDEEHLPRAMVRNGFSGWYNRVLHPGTLEQANAVTLEDRPNPDFAFARLVEILNHGNGTKEELSRMARMPELASQWRTRAQATLDRLR